MMSPNEITLKTERLKNKCWDDLVLALLGLAISLLYLHGFVTHIVIGWYYQAPFLALTFIVGLCAPIPWYRTFKELRRHIEFLKRLHGSPLQQSNHKSCPDYRRVTNG